MLGLAVQPPSPLPARPEDQTLSEWERRNKCIGYLLVSNVLLLLTKHFQNTHHFGTCPQLSEVCAFLPSSLPSFLPTDSESTVTECPTAKNE